MVASYSEALEVEELISIIGKEGLSEEQKYLLDMGEKFEQLFLTQDFYDNREILKTLTIGWQVLSNMPESMLIRINEKYIERYQV